MNFMANRLRIRFLQAESRHEQRFSCGEGMTDETCKRRHSYGKRW